LDKNIINNHATASNSGLPAAAHTRLRPNWHIVVKRVLCLSRIIKAAKR